MKTYFLNPLLCLTFLFIGTSCSTDNDSVDEESNLLIGVWKPIKYVEVCLNDPGYVYNYTSCEQKGRLSFNANGNFNETFFYEDNLFGLSCIQDESEMGTWVMEGEGLSVTIDGVVAEVGFFVLNENNLKLGQYDSELGCVGESSHFYVEYVRVN